jgi:outer membrane protein assembly factor BamE
MQTRSFLALLFCAPLLTACFLTPHKIDVQQGNYLDKEAVSKLKLGMTRSQERFLLGTPLVADPFHPDRWDYLFIDYKGGKLKDQKRLTLTFDGDKLKTAITDLPIHVKAPAPDQTAASGR